MIVSNSRSTHKLRSTTNLKPEKKKLKDVGMLKVNSV